MIRKKKQRQKANRKNMTASDKKLRDKKILWLASNPSMVVQFYLPHLRNLLAAGARLSLATNFNGAADKKKLLETQDHKDLQWILDHFKDK